MRMNYEYGRRMNNSYDRKCIWLSAAPEFNEQPDAGLEVFVRRLTARVCQKGDTIVHGMQPVVTKWLTDELKDFDALSKRESLTLVVSYFYSRCQDVRANVARLREEYNVYEAPMAQDKDREPSLSIMREVLATKSNVVVAVGGKINEKVRVKEGVSEEIDLALRSNLPCYIVGGFGGAARLYADRHPEAISKLRNGLTAEENKQLIQETDAEAVLDLIYLGLSRLPLQKVGHSWSGPFRILALDGGGIKGAYSAAVIASIEKAFDCRIGEYFDLVSGTSTGGLLATGIAAGHSGAEMLDFYQEYGQKIFPKRGIITKVLRSFTSSSLYSGKDLRQVLCPILSENGVLLTMKDACCRLLIPSFDVVKGKPYYFITPHLPLKRFDSDTTLLDVAMATSAAPVYFPMGIVKSDFSESHYMDGALVANSPVLAAVLHAVHSMGVDPGQISVLHIGTTTTPPSHKNPSRRFYNLGNVIDTARAFLVAQEDFMRTESKALVGALQYLSIDECRDVDEFSLSDASSSALRKLTVLGEHAIRNDELMAQLKSQFFNGLKVVDWRSFKDR